MGWRLEVGYESGNTYDFRQLDHFSRLWSAVYRRFSCGFGFHCYRRKASGSRSRSKSTEQITNHE